MKKKSFLEVVEEIRGKRILVANRGIPARRIVRSIREFPEAVSVVTATDIDKTAPFISGAQELILIGDNPRAYLDVDRIIHLAKTRNIAAIHPAWGFASEDATFPEKCQQAGIVFIGPDARTMRLLGNKVQVRRVARELDIPTVPGSEGAVDIAEAKAIARQIGFPIMLKAEGGGGGRGIYEIYREEELDDAFEKASALAQSSFGNPRLFVEKLLTSVRHIEIQVVADHYGNVFAFDERDCSIQRNHQKLIEITPSPWLGMTSTLRSKLKQYARELIRHVGYVSLATVEFLIDADANPYLIEVNTRLQVEHGITECRYGIDLVEEQIAIAFGARLRFNEESLTPLHYAMQTRINCEDPQVDFSPNSGRISRYISPGGPGIRLDSCISSGYQFPAQYDSAAALLIAYGRSWPKVMGILARALTEYLVGGIKTTIPFHRQIFKSPAFRSGEFDTRFIQHNPQFVLYKDHEPEALRLSRLVAVISAKGYNPFVALGQYRGRGDHRLGRLEPVVPALKPNNATLALPRKDRTALLDRVRDSGKVHFTDTTTRDVTQSNSGNRFRLAEDTVIGPYLDHCGLFSIENGGGAHFHVAMLANKTYPFNEAAQWNRFAPQTPKQILVRSTNLLGYKPQPRNLMALTGEMICKHYDVIRCFDFLNHIENMRPLAEVVLSSDKNVFEPAISLSWAKGFDVPHYLSVLEEIVKLVVDVSGLSRKKATEIFILGLKDMAGVCPPQFIAELIRAIRKKYPRLIIHYHRHYTDGLFIPSVGAAAKAGAHIVDVAMGAAVRWYGQGDVLATAAYIEDTLGLETAIDKEMVEQCNFILKQIMPYYDRYTAPYFQGTDYCVVKHGMPGGATSSCQEGAMKQGYIQLLPDMLRFLTGTRQIVRYHDVTPGSQITWNTAFLGVTSAFKQGGERQVRHFLDILEAVVDTPEDELSDKLKKERLTLYRESNDSFRDLLLGRFGRLPLGFPPDWVYESAFGPEYRQAIAQRAEDSPLIELTDIDIAQERDELRTQLGREPLEEELVMYLNHPTDALGTMKFRQEFGNPNRIPLDIWFEGLEPKQELQFNDSQGKPHLITILDISDPDEQGASTVRYVLDDESFTYDVKVAEASSTKVDAIEMAEPDNPLHVACPSNGDLWIVYVQPGDMVKQGDEIFNISIMKQEKAILAPTDGMVKRVLKSANFKEDKRMVPVREGELIVELGPVRNSCTACGAPISGEDFSFCPSCGAELPRNDA
ncbi:MAG: pyruvate carboxylase [Myxococcota bacterium]|nr:pyruvate carboxylase [Myxococcota bacterium]